MDSLARITDDFLVGLDKSVFFWICDASNDRTRDVNSLFICWIFSQKVVSAAMKASFLPRKPLSSVKLRIVSAAAVHDRNIEYLGEVADQLNLGIRQIDAVFPYDRPLWRTACARTQRDNPLRPSARWVHALNCYPLGRALRMAS